MVWSIVDISGLFEVRVVIKGAPFLDSGHHHCIWVSIRYHVRLGCHSIAMTMSLQQNICIF